MRKQVCDIRIDVFDDDTDEIQVHHHPGNRRCQRVISHGHLPDDFMKTIVMPLVKK